MKIYRLGVHVCMRKIVIILVIAIVIFQTGCSNAEIDKEVAELNLRISGLEAETIKDKKTIKDLKKQIAENEVIETATTPPEVKWMSSSNWDKIIVSEVTYPVQRVVITDKAFLKSEFLFGDVTVDNSTEGLGGGRYEAFKFEFVKGAKKYTISVESYENVIKYKGKYYKTEFDIMALGFAMLPRFDFLSTVNTMNKIYQSKIFKHYYAQEMNTTISFSNYEDVCRHVAGSVQEGLDNGGIRLLSEKPRSFGKVTEKMVFYYFGSILEIKTYKSYMSIEDSGIMKWYKVSSAVDVFAVWHAG